MKAVRVGNACIVIGAIGFVVEAQDLNFVQHVNPFVGTEGGGNMFPGVAAAPFAVVKLGPDVLSGNADPYSGYLPTGNITGFSMLHESGTGGAPKYGVVSQMPAVGAVGNPLADLSSPRAQPDTASVGYYQSTLANGVKVELTASNHAGVYRYTFPPNQGGSIVVDVSHVLPSFRGSGWGQNYKGGNISIAKDGHYEGVGTYDNGWNLSPNWNIYFCGKFDQQASNSSVFKGVGTALSRYDNKDPKSESGSERVGAVFMFPDTSVTSYVGVSWTSIAKACKNLEEVARPTPFETAVDNARDSWTTDVFSKVQVKGGSQEDLLLLYTALYGMHLIPSNRTGDNPHWQSNEPYYDDIFTLWDLSRCSTALMHVLQPVAYGELIRSFIDIWRHEGWMPDGRSSNFNGRTQGGSNVDNVLADAYVKDVRGGINWEDAFKAMQSNAERQPPNNNDPSAPDSSTKEGRGALPDWINLGYITPKFSRAVSRAVEYSTNDFGLHQVAKGLGLDTEAGTYLQRSRNWRNHWDAKASSTGHSGFMVPREANGNFVPQDPLDCGGCYWRDAYYQGLPWEYSMNAHHDFATITEYVGGTERMVDRIDTMFVPGLSKRTSEKFGRTIFDPGNQPSFTTPYLYNFVGRQDKAVNQSRYIAKSYYSTASDGLPGNSDAGAMQTWLLWNMIGLYPMTGQTTFLIGSPWFEEMTISLGGNKSLRITSTGGNSDDAFYVQSLKVNGRNWVKSWVTWRDIFENGGLMEFVLGPEAVDWATGELPPSPATENSLSSTADDPVVPDIEEFSISKTVVTDTSEASALRTLGGTALSLTGVLCLALSFWL